ncbi:MAG: hypothetical protein QXS18_05610 [Thermoplasmata archaeon]
MKERINGNMPQQTFLNFVVRIDGLEQINRKLLVKRKKLDDFSPIFKEFTKDWFEKQKKMFENEGFIPNEGRPYDKKWKELSPKYKEWKEKNYPGKKILELTGGLKRALTDMSNAIITAKVLTIKAGARIVNGWNLARLHKYGTRRMPARDPFAFSVKQKERWIMMLRNWLRERPIREGIS